MLSRIHPIAGMIGFLMILTFFVSTITSEAFGSVATVIAVKDAIPWGFLILVPALIAAGASGFRLAGGDSAPEIPAKKRRMPIIAANGLLVLVPCALYLAMLASREQFDSRFYVLQAVELIAGATNITLMGLNVRDGLRLTGRFNSATTPD